MPTMSTRAGARTVVVSKADARWFARAQVDQEPASGCSGRQTEVQSLTDEKRCPVVSLPTTRSVRQ